MAAIPLVLSAAWSAVTAAATTFATALMGGSGLMAGISAWGTVASVASLGAALLMKPPGLESAGQQVNLQLTGSGAFLPVVVGRSGVQGLINYRKTYDIPGGPENDVLLVESILSVGPINRVSGFTVTSRALTFSGNPSSTLATVTGVSGVDMVKSKLYREAGLKVHHRVGSHTDTATLASITGESPPGITSAHTNPGLARTVIRCRLDKKSLNFPQGFPDDPVSVVEGILSYDPRLDSTYPGGSGSHRWADTATRTWSENPAIVALNYALGLWAPNGELIIGFGLSLDDTDVAAFVAAANVCDANGWKVGGQFTEADGGWAILSNILAAGGSIPFISQGRLSCFVRTPQVSTFTLTANDILGSPSVTTTPSMMDRPNRVIPSYRSENQKWEIIPGETVENEDWLALDGGDPRTLELTFPLVQQAAQAHQLAAYQVADQREMMEISLEAKPRALAPEVGRIITIDLPLLGVLGDFLVLDSTWDDASKVVRLTLRADSGVAKHEFCLGQSQEAPPPATLRTWSAANPSPPASGSWSISATEITGANSTTPALIVTGEVGDPTAQRVIVETRRPVTEDDVFPEGTGDLTADEIEAAIADFGWTLAASGPKTATEFALTAVEPDQSYEVGVSYESTLAAVSDRLILGPISTSLQFVAGVSPGVIDWGSNAVVNPIANVPVVLTDLDGEGRINANGVAYGNVSVANAIGLLTIDLSGVESDLANAISASNSVLISAISEIANVSAQAATFRGYASANATAADVARANTIASRDAALTAATAALANATSANSALGQAITSRDATITAALQAVANASAANSALANAISSRDAALTSAGWTLANAIASANSSAWAASNSTLAQTRATWANSNAQAAQQSATYASANATLAFTSAGLSAVYQGQASTSAGVASSAAGYATSNAAIASSNSALAVGFASAANAARSQAVANATIASTQAGYASDNASAAQSDAILSANYSDQAGANASASNTARIAAQSNATIATTQAGYATANAALASSNATLSAGYAGSSNAARAQAVANALIASTQAGYASDNSSLAQASAGLSAAYQGQAATSAGVASTQAGYATVNAAIATSNAILSATYSGQAGANASASNAARVAAQANATIAATQAGYASDNASAALSDALLSATFSGQAQSNSSAANAARIAAQANATISATQAGYATANAALASSNATLSATYSGQAQSNSTAANTARVSAQANASISAAQAGYASDNAAAALADSTLASTFRGFASANAVIASQQATYATSNASIASSNATLAVGFAGQANAARAQAVSNASIASTQAGYASDNASAAEAEASLTTSYRGWASANATIASTQAGYATSNAALASSNASLAVGFSGTANAARAQAVSNASIASTQAGYAADNAASALSDSNLTATLKGWAQANATIAQQQATYATSNATLASSNATLSATRAGWALSNAGVASTQAGYAADNASAALSDAALSATFRGFAAANATLSQTQSSYATSNASLANSQRGLAATYAGYALSNASISETQAGYASANATAASTSSGLAVSYATAGRGAVSDLIPSRFDNREFWSHSYTGPSADLATISASYVTTDATYGQVYISPSATAEDYVYSRGIIPVSDGSIIEISITGIASAILGGDAPALRPYIRSFYGNGTYIQGAGGSYVALTTSDISTSTRRFTISDWGAGASYIRPSLRYYQATTTGTRVKFIELKARDVTALVAAEGEASNAASSAGIATSQAGYASANASAASSNATLSATHSGYAAGNATLANTRAGYAAANATIASIQAGYASANVTLAVSNATLSATHSGYSAANATLANTRAGYALSNATIASQQASYATANAAAALASQTLSASIVRDAGSPFVAWTNATIAEFWTATEAGTPDVVGSISNSYLVSTDQGLAISLISNDNYVAPKGLMRVLPNRIWRYTAVARRTTGTAASLYFYRGGLLANAVATGSGSNIYNEALTTDWKVITYDFSTNDHAATAVWARPRVRTAQTTASIQIASFDVLDVTPDATTSTAAGAVVGPDGKIAFWRNETAVSGASTFISAWSQANSTATPTSNVAIGAQNVSIWNPSAAVWKPALSVSGGDVVLSGGLTAGGFIRLGSGSWPVALQSKSFLAADGASIDFGVNLGAVPDYEFVGDNLLPLASGETYDLSLTSLTANGATVRAKIATPGTPSSYNLTTDSAPGSGPTRQIDKASNPDSSTGSYTFTVSGTHVCGYLNTFEAGEAIEVGGTVTVQIYKMVSNAWTNASTMTVSTATTVASSGTPGSASTTLNWESSDTFNLGSSVQKFGVSFKSQSGGTSGTVNDLDSVAWTAAGNASGTRTALTSGVKTTVRIYPKNGA